MEKRSSIPAEILSVIDAIKRDRSLWKRVAGLHGAKFEIRFCCNSHAVRRVLVQQRGSAVLLTPSSDALLEMPTELCQILDKSENDGELHVRVAAFSRGKFDLVFRCSEGELRGALIQEVS